MVQIVLGSKSDLPVAEKAQKILSDLDIPYNITIASAHRTPKLVHDLVTRSDAKVFIAIAGLSAALPGVIASLTTKPVIGVPVSGKLNLDAILSIVQLPPGVPVACVGLDNGENAALLATEILALADKRIGNRLKQYRAKLSAKVRRAATELEQSIQGGRSGAAPRD